MGYTFDPVVKEGLVPSGGGGGGAAQTPWTSNINGAGYSLSSVGTASVAALTITGITNAYGLVTNSSGVVSAAPIVNYITTTPYNPAASAFTGYNFFFFGATNDQVCHLPQVSTIPRGVYVFAFVGADLQDNNVTVIPHAGDSLVNLPGSSTPSTPFTTGFPILQGHTLWLFSDGGTKWWTFTAYLMGIEHS